MMNRDNLIKHLADKCSRWNQCILMVSNHSQLDAWVFQNEQGYYIRVGGDGGGVISESDWQSAIDEKIDSINGKDCSVSNIRKQAKLAEKYVNALHAQMHCLRRIASTSIPDGERQGCINGHEECKRQADALLIELTKGNK